MPNGVMTGNGSRDNPWIVEDAWDFNALRDIPATDASSVAFVELGADISLAVYPTFTPIPSRFFNIDGKGHIISDISVENFGLFEEVRFTEYLRNIVVEGEVTVGTSAQVGLLAARAVATVTGAIIENIKGFGSVTSVLSANSARHAGIFGFVQMHSPGQTMLRVRDCSFKGTFMASFTNSTTSGAGGIVALGGVLNVNLSAGGFGGANATVQVSRCFSDISVVVIGSQWTGINSSIGGVVGGTVSTSGTNEMISCVGRVQIHFTGGTNTRVWRLSGCFGVHEGIGATRLIRCVGFIKLIYNPLAAFTGQIHINGLVGQVGNSGISVSQSYGVIEYENPNSIELPPTFTINGLGPSTTAVGSFFDISALRATWGGDINQEALGRTTQQLQDRGFLESQGWVF